MHRCLNVFCPALRFALEYSLSAANLKCRGIFLAFSPLLFYENGNINLFKGIFI